MHEISRYPAGVRERENFASGRASAEPSHHRGARRRHERTPRPRAQPVPLKSEARQTGRVGGPRLRAEHRLSVPLSRRHLGSKPRSCSCATAGECQCTYECSTPLPCSPPSPAGSPASPPLSEEPSSAAADGGVRIEGAAGWARRMLVVLAGWPKTGDLRHAVGMFGVEAETVDLLEGGWRRDVLSPGVFGTMLQRVRERAHKVVWIAPPYSSFSVLHLRAVYSQGVLQRACGGSARLSRRTSSCTTIWRGEQCAADERSGACGCDIRDREPTVDRGERGSDVFRVRFRERVPIWLLPAMRRLQEASAAVKVKMAERAFSGDFQKLTTLMWRRVRVPLSSGRFPLVGAVRACEARGARERAVK